MSKAKAMPVSEGEWECMECGFIEEGVSNRRPKSCPECNAPGSAFEFFEYEEDDFDDFDDDIEEYEEEEYEYDDDDDDW